MALYSYSIFIARELQRGALTADLVRLGLIASESMLGVPFASREWENQRRASCPLSVVELALQEAAFDSLLRERPDELIHWLWRTLVEAEVAHLFIPGGGDFPYFEEGRRTDVVAVEQLGELVETGVARVVHPLMLFAARTGACEWASRVQSMLVESRPNVGCLLILGERDATSGALEIFEPATLYDGLREEVRRLQSQT